MPTCTAGSWCRPMTAQTSAWCSGTRTASRPPAATARSRSVRGPWTPDGCRPRDGSGRRPHRCSLRAGDRPRAPCRGPGGGRGLRERAELVVARAVPVTTSRGELQVAVAYGGAFYATLPAAEVGLSVTPDDLGHLIALGREIKWALNDSEHAVHRTDPGRTASTGPSGSTSWATLVVTPVLRCTSACPSSPDGEVDRSPCGSGTCARLAVLADEGRLSAGGILRHGRSWLHLHRHRARNRHGRRPARRRAAGHRDGVPHRGASSASTRTIRWCRVRAAVTAPRFLDAAAIHAACPPGAAVAAVEAALRGGLDPTAEPPRSVVQVAHGQFLLMPSEAGRRRRGSRS